MEELISYHQNKLDWHQEELNIFQNLPEWTKDDAHKEIYYRMIRKHEKAVKFHEQAVRLLEECVK